MTQHLLRCPKLIKCHVMSLHQYGCQQLAHLEKVFRIV